MKAIIKELKSEFSTKEIILYSILTILCAIICLCGETVINMIA